MRQWIFLLGGLLVWTAHFFALYAAASLFPGTALARWLTVGLTVAALLAVALVGLTAARRWRASADQPNENWNSGLALLGCALAVVAIVFGGLPGLMG